jgi:PKD domain-containing protein/concanavalin A-like lectin/glucanase superfamily protein/type IX secretion system substrate protein
MKKITLFLFAAVLSASNTKAQTGGLGLNFDGTDDRVTVPTNAAYNVGTGDFTIEAWVKLNSTQNVSTPTIISKRDAVNTNTGFMLFVLNGKVYLQVTGSNYGPGTANIKDNICHHVAVTRTGTVLNYYVDGNPDGTFSSAGNISTTHNLWIGRDEISSSTTPLKGMIHELRYWNIARTQSQIQSTKDAFLTGNESGLIGYWRMNDGSGQTVNDFSSLNNDGFLGSVNTTDNADPVYQSGCLCPSTITAGGATTFCTGGNVVLTASSGTGLTYQWQLNASNISGATSISYTATLAGNYTCIITGLCGGVTSNIITVTVYTTAPTAVITAGGPATFCSGGSVTLNANTGTGITYQWQLNSSNISGATNAGYTASAAGSYRCVETNPCGSSTSNTIAVTVNSNPTATITPAGPVTFCTGGSVLLTASSGAGYTWQWKKNGTNISGATLQTYSVTQSGSYTVAVTAAGCTATSAGVTVVADQALTPAITNSGISGFCGSTTINLQTPSGTGFIFQWLEDTHPIPNTNSSTLVAGHNGNYSVNVTNSCGTYSSAPVTVTNFDIPPLAHYNMISYSGSLIICTTGGSVSLYNDGAANYYSPTFQWYKDGVAISGAVSSAYSATSAGIYVCSVFDYLFCTGTNGPTVFSNWLTVGTTPGTAPTVSISAGGPTTFCTPGSVALNSTVNTSVSYQWKNNGVNISGATSSSYTANAAGNYTCYVSNSCGNATSGSIAVTVHSFPVASITAGGSTNLCTGYVIGLTATTGSWTYQWKKNGTNISGATFNNYTANASGNYTVVTTNSCGSSNSNTITVTVNTTPTVSISAAGSVTFCTGGSVTLNATSTGATYQWRKDGTNIPGATSSSYTATNTGSYTVFVLDVSGNCSAISNAISVSVFGSAFLLLQPNAATGIDAFVDSYSTLANTNLGTFPEMNAMAWTSGGTPYLVRGFIRFDLSAIPANAVINQATLTLFNDPTSANGYPVGQHSSLSGSNAGWLQRVTAAWNESTITWNNQPPVTTVNQVALPQSTNGFQDYDINVTTSVQDMFINPGTNFGFMLRLQTESYYRSLIFASSDNPDSTNWPKLAISYSYNPVITAAGPTTFCSGGNVQLNTTPSAGLTYQWKLNGTNISGATAAAYTATGTGNYTVVVTDIYNCSNTSSQLTVTVNPLPSVSFSGLAASYNVTSPPATLTGSPAGGTFSGPGISGNSFNPAVAGAGGPYTITYSYTDGNGCSNSSSQTTTVLNCVVPAMPSSITGPASPCANSTGKVYSCPSVSGATSYTWAVPSTATLVSGQGTTSITVNFGSAFTSGIIGVSAVNCAGSSAQKTKNVFDKPATPGAITGQKTGVCAGTSNVSYSIPGVGGATTYTWTAPANASIISGQGTTAIAVNYNSSFTSGTLSVTAGNTCGTSAVKNATINSKPPTPGAISGPTTFCSNQQGVAYSISAVNGATTYDWLVPTGAIVATGQGTASITVNYGTKNGKVKISAGNACGFSAYKQLNVTKNCREAFGEEETENTIRVYPNPSSGDFVFEISNAENEKIFINIYDMIGKLVLSESKNNSQFTIHNSQLSSGIYSAEIIYGENKKVLKLIKTE